MLRKHVEKYMASSGIPTYMESFGLTVIRHPKVPVKNPLFGVDLKSPSEAALLPPEEVEESEVTEYCEQLALTLREARDQAALPIQQAQSRIMTRKQLPTLSGELTES